MSLHEPSRLAVLPTCGALLTARLVWRDPATGDFLIHGVLTAIRPRVYPFVMPELGVFAEFTDGRGDISIALRIIPEGGEEPLAVANNTLHFPNPLVIVPLMVRFYQVVFPHPGMYLLQARSEGNLLMQRRFTLEPLAQG